MKWFAGALLLLVAALVFDLGLLAYAMYALLGVMLVSRVLARSWSENLTAVRTYSRGAVNIGDAVAVVVTVENKGLLPVAWMLLEDLLPRHALLHNPPNLHVTGRRLHLAMLKSRGRKTLYYQLKCNRRGYYQIGPLMLETGDLFGLHRRHRILSEPSFLGLPTGRAAGRFRHRLASPDRRGAHGPPSLRRPDARVRHSAVRSGRPSLADPLACHRADRPSA